MTVHVRIDPQTQAIEVEGVDISRSIRRVTLDLKAGRQPEVFLELGAGQLVPEVLTVDGVVHVVRDEMDPGPVVLSWLESIDAVALEAAVLEDVDMDESTGQAFLTQLAKLAANGQ